jgi:hypothetical protein
VFGADGELHREREMNAVQTVCRQLCVRESERDEHDEHTPVQQLHTQQSIKVQIKSGVFVVLVLVPRSSTALSTTPATRKKLRLSIHEYSCSSQVSICENCVLSLVNSSSEPRRANKQARIGSERVATGGLSWRHKRLCQQQQQQQQQWVAVGLKHEVDWKRVGL